jgi:phospho-N-acetylmuramoyl-pentapeptide-transferase
MTNIILLSFVISLFLTNILINIFRQSQVKQYILKESPETHLVKEGTPTMGGIAIIISVLFSLLIAVLFFKYNLSYNVLFVLFLLISFAFIGLIDDLRKIKKQENKGISAKAKLFLQIIFASIFAGFFAVFNDFSTIQNIQGSFQLVEIVLYYVFIVFLIVGTSNAVNLTDGLDGLATGLLIISFLGFAFFAFITTNASVLFLLAILIGSLFGFLWFNLNPAKIFMGDTGSLALGATLAGISILLDRELLLILLGFIFLIETLSVIIQVSYFRISKGKRIFKMSPIHHHFELSGWTENKIVTRFWIIGIIMLIIAIKIG